MFAWIRGPSEAAGPQAARAREPALPPLFAGPRRRLLLGLIGLGLLQALQAVLIALAVRATFNALNDAHGAAGLSAWLAASPASGYIAAGLVCAAALLAAAGSLSLRRWAGQWAEALGQEYVSAVRVTLLGHLFNLAPRRHQRMRHGHLMARLTGDLGALHRWAGRTVAPMLVGATTLLMLGLTVVCLTPWLALAAALAGAPFVAWAWWTSAKLETALRAERSQRWALVGQVGERLAQAAVVQANGQALRELKRLRRRQQRLHTVAVERASQAATLHALPPTLGSLLLVLLAGWGAAQVLAGAWSTGTLAGLLTLLGLSLTPLRECAMGLGGWRNWRVACEKLSGFLRTPASPADSAQTPLNEAQGNLRLHQWVPIEGMPAITLNLPRASSLALQGSSGSGKSAVLEAIAGLLEPLAGQLLLDGQDLARVQAQSRRRHIALVSPDLPLLRGSVAANLRYRNRSASAAELSRALREAGVTALSAAAPLTLASAVAEGGRNLPRCVRARLGLARALLDRPAVLLIDDFDALLDGQEAADAPLAKLLAAPPCTLVIATKQDAWALRCQQAFNLSSASRNPGPAPLELVHAA